MGKRKVMLLYGEKTVQVNLRIPESKRDEILGKFNDILKEYHNLSCVEIDVNYHLHPSQKEEDYSLGKVLGESIKKNIYNARDYDLPKVDVMLDSKKKIEPQVVDEVIKKPVKEVKKIDEDMMAKLRDIAAGKNLSGGFELTKKKVNIDDVYSFEYVKGFPDLEDCIFVDKKGIACYDKYNLGIFYIKWEGKYLMFDDKKEFERFCKDNLIT